MSLKAGIVGLPNVGKSTLFSALTKIQAESANYPFTTIEPNISIVELNDPRIDELLKIVKTQKVIKATFEFVDIAGLVKGASEGAGLGNKFLSNIREVDMIVQVIRCFENKDIIHVANTVDSIRDFEIITHELVLADLQSAINIKNRISKKAQSGDKKTIEELNLINKLINQLESFKPLNQIDFNDEEKNILKQYQFLTIKPMLVVANIDVKDINNLDNNKHYINLKTYLSKLNYKLIPLAINVECDLSFLDEEEKELFLNEYNINESGLNLLVRETFKTLNLATYFTVGEKEIHAWTFKKGMKAPECAGLIHNDFLKKFVKAEVIFWEDFINCGGEKEAKEKGKMHLEGKEYIMQDGDICVFKIGK